MKQFKLVVFLLVGFFALNSHAQVKTKPVAGSDSEVKITEKTQITFKNAVHDFGAINEGDTVETTFEYTNTGNAPLQIQNIKASCGCTIPSNWSREPLQPGDSGSFTVKFNSNNKPNRQQKKISIICNTKKGNEYVTIKAQVAPDPEKEVLRVERRKVVLQKRKERLAKEKAAVEAKRMEGRKEKIKMENDKKGESDKK